MTDYDGPPLTRRERKERERALAEATDQTPAVDTPAEGQSAEAQQAPGVGESQSVASPVAERVPTPEPESQPGAVHAESDGTQAEPDETQAIDVSELIADLRPQSAPVAENGTANVEASPQAQPTGLGRFFGRRGLPTQADDADVAVAPPATSSEQHEPESIGDVLADLQRSPVDPRQPEAHPIPRIEVDDLDTVDDAEVDRLEIDEVVVADAPVSSRRIAESTPAELEDRRALVEDAEIEVQAGPSRATGRLPVVVNVVEDTSRHHIADLREDTSAISASSVGTGTSTITANALVLPASGANEPITVETADGVIVTGSIDLPDGFASSGRSRGTIDTADVDAADDGGEVRSPETQPVRASRAVSSYANARVRIAPQRRTRNTLPIALGVGGGVAIVAVGATVLAFLVGWI